MEQVEKRIETAIRRIECLLMGCYAKAHERGAISQSDLLHLGWIIENIQDMPIDELRRLLDEIEGEGME